MLTRAWIVTKHTYVGFNRDDCLQLAAAISYYILFSVVPLFIFFVSVFGFFLNNANLRADLVDRIINFVPLSSTEGRSSVENILNSVKSASGPGAVIGAIGTMWAGSAVFASVRKSLNRVWATRDHRAYLHQKLIDLMQVGFVGLLLIASLSATAILRVLRSNAPGGVTLLRGSSPVWELPAILLPSLLTIALFLFLYRVVPAIRPRWRDIIPGALVATLLFEVLKNTFAIYVAYFNNFDVVYGSLAGLLLFLVYNFLGANIILIGAELSFALQRYHAGDMDQEIARAPQSPVATRALRAVRGLFVRD